MRLGVNVPNFGPGTSPGVLRSWAQTVEGLGFDLLMVSDHIAVTPDVAEQYPAPFYEPFTTLAWLAGITSRVRLGTTVLIVPYRHPLLIARMAANLNQLSGGRLVLGVGAGWNEDEHEAYGIPLPPLKERFDRLEEGIAVIKALWTGGPVDFEGRFYRLHGAAAYPRPVQRPAPPLLIGGDGEIRLLRIVARDAGEWNSHAPGPDAYRLKRAKLEEHCRAVGRNPDAIHRSWMGGVLIARNGGELAEKGRWMQSFLAALRDVRPDGAPDELRRRSWIVGTPDQVASQLDAWSAVGVERVMFQWYNLDDLDGLDLLAQVNRP